MRVPVFPTKFVSGWAGPSADTDDDVVFAEVLDVVTALTTAYPDDAHGVGYAFKDDTVCPRVDKDAVRRPEVDHELRMYVGFIDLDRPGHAPWSDRAEAERAVATLVALFPRLAVFATRAGVRMVYVLPEPLRIAEFKLFGRAVKAQAEAIIQGAGLQVEVDKSTAEWTRMFRMPNVVRDGKRTAEDFYYTLHIPGTFGPLPSMPDNVLGASVLPGKTLAETDTEDEPAARPTDAVVTDEEWDELFDVFAERLHRKGWSGLLLKARQGVPFYEPGERNSTTFRALAAVLSVAADVGVELTADGLYAIFEASTAATTGNTSPEDALAELWGMAHRLVKSMQFVEDPAHLRLPQKYITTAYGDLPRIAYTAGKSRYVWMGEAYSEAFASDDSLRAFFRSKYQNYFPIAKVPTVDLLTNYGEFIKGVILDLGATEPRLEGGFLIVPMERRAAIEAVHHADCAEWLEHIAGDDLDGVLDWLFWFPHLQHNVCALFLCGAPAAGKSMLGQALSQFWGGEFCSFDHAMGNFTGQLRKSGLVWLDEGTRAKEASAAFRRLVANDRHQIEQKHRDPETVRGCFRLLITANREGALPLDDVQSVEDVRAILERVRFVHVSEAASNWLRGKGGRAYTEEWVTRKDGRPGKLAEHIAWIIQHHTPRTSSHGDRFKVQGRPTAWHYRALYSGAVGSVLSVVAEQVALDNSGGFAYYDRARGDVLVNVVGLLAHNKVRDVLRAEDVDLADARAILRGVCGDDEVEVGDKCFLALPSQLIRDMPRHVFRTDGTAAAIRKVFANNPTP